ncbi:hypothetical protein GQ55_7G265500 [Panicum hallii var. hallii]|uniref:Uncharacterized protein n=1 Tax=Panicum hallii var. hallii TaxID=1504633 RepID=A0A2T7CZD8_9POAL|nr:hypothetical protein GQ55_7G265500 [Panicum hallii var. hallii]
MLLLSCTCRAQVAQILIAGTSETFPYLPRGQRRQILYLQEHNYLLAGRAGRRHLLQVNSCPMTPNPGQQPHQTFAPTWPTTETIQQQHGICWLLGSAYARPILCRRQEQEPRLALGLLAGTEVDDDGDQFPFLVELRRQGLEVLPMPRLLSLPIYFYGSTYRQWLGPRARSAAEHNQLDL